MTTAATIESPARLARRWFAFLGGGLAWTFHLLTIYVIGEFGCVSGFGRLKVGGISAVAWSLLAVGVLSLAPALAAMLVGWADVRRDARSQHTRDDDGGRYLSKFGWLLSALFSLIIVVESLPLFAYLEGC